MPLRENTRVIEELKVSFGGIKVALRQKKKLSITSIPNAPEEGVSPAYDG
jgi:hypothetical protein